jgi:hypothetical protein
VFLPYKITLFGPLCQSFLPIPVNLSVDAQIFLGRFFGKPKQEAYICVQQQALSSTRATIFTTSYAAFRDNTNPCFLAKATPLGAFTQFVLSVP